MLQGKTIGFLGAGAIAEALMRGLLDGGVVKPDQILVTNRANRERLDALARRFGVATSESRAAVVRQADIAVLLCKPKDVPALMAEVGGFTRSGQVLLSVAAGVPTLAIAAQAAPGVQVVRAMPNTSSQIGQSATAMCPGPGTGGEALALCRTILGAVGTVAEVPEPLMDAVTGLAGTGPAYIYYVVEALLEAGRQVGLSDATARDLVLQTVKGAALMLAETGEDPAHLRRKVTSPGGTTMAGIGVLEEAGFAGALVRAVGRATERSRELGAAAATAATPAAAAMAEGRGRDACIAH